ncbi:hypothetical protein CRM22_009749 [Opisthorchis felineus]|nr:hypothetical protein CRM22_009749 [Opisthorchis felineus]
MLRSILSTAPKFTGECVHNGTKTTVESAYFTGKYTIILFYPSNFVQSTAEELLALDQSLSEFERLNCTLLVITPDSIESQTAWYRAPLESNGLGGSVRFPLLSDKTFSVCRAYGVLREDKGVPLRSLFILDPLQKIRVVLSMDVGIMYDISEILRIVKYLTDLDNRPSRNDAKKA